MDRGSTGKIVCGHVVVVVYLHRLFEQKVIVPTTICTQLLSFLTVSELLNSTATVHPYKFGHREKFGKNTLNAFYVTLNLAPGLQRLQRFDLLT
ncbi:hypothetical protein DPMN_125992 [Dreissena polymorpha]|uniref:Uncharacterized protein n=1 Tax=Dreissena polymorpha TaxID=45954 RepID=A0A9D4H2G9_DREPO|nr:hypothetical protein DPMN_125992 [Dreissena polymorpha]